MSIRSGSSFSAMDNLFDLLVGDSPWANCTIINVFLSGVNCDIMSSSKFISLIYDSVLFVIHFEGWRQMVI